jgi:glyoxylase-like metal-dependent hydrolase (beta-lactamase superfamily II)
LPLVVCLVALLSGCGVQMFLRVDRVDVDERLRYFLGGGGNSFAFLHDGVAFISDPKLGPGARRFRKDVEVDLGRQVQRILLTHWHGDHANGVDLYQAPVVIVHPNGKKRLEEKGMRAHWVEVDQEITLTLGGETVRVLSLGSGHTDGDLVALFVSRKLLVAGDLVLDHYEPHIDEKSGGSVLALRDTLDRVLTLDFERVLPGHGEPMVKADVVHLREYLRAVEASAKVALDKGLADEAAVASMSVTGFDDLKALPFATARADTFRRMVKELRAAKSP